jgi:[ribosomal protein S5]-alanine N-acetyltransferase
LLTLDFAGQGLMSEGVRLGIKYAFYTLNLHRVEANIQPENIASIGLVKRMSFAKEGFSRRYLYINGDWRDHERWALTVEDLPDPHTPHFSGQSLLKE